MECTMPTAKFTPVDNVKTLEYVFECLEEAFRGLSFVDPNTGLDIKKLKKKVADVAGDVGEALRYA